MLFTDVEGSTRLAQRLGDDYPELLTAHRRLVRFALEAHGGVEVESRGDEFFAVFAEPSAAVQAAVAIQRALAEHPWPSDSPVRVRMGIHTGTPTVADDGYLGLDVHRAARISSAGHGGQILLSAVTLERLGEALPAGLAVTDLGAHELRGMPVPEHLFQLGIVGREERFPPLRTGQIQKTEPAPGAYAERDESDPSTRPPAPPAKPRMRIVLSDDSVLLREGLARLLEEAGLEVVAQSGTAEDLLRHVAMHKPDVAIVDIRMPPTHTDEGLRAAQTIRERFPDVGVLVLSQYVEPAYALELLANDAEGVGYLLKDRVSDIDDFATAVRRVAEGGSALDPAVVNQLVGKKRERSSDLCRE